MPKIEEEDDSRRRDAPIVAVEGIALGEGRIAVFTVK
jgi:hypothetical protein